MPVQQYPASQLTQRAQQAHALHSLHQMPTQRTQQQRPVQAMGQLPMAQRGQQSQPAQAAMQHPAAQCAPRLQPGRHIANISGAQQASQPSLTASLQQQMQDLEAHRMQQLLQQRMSLPSAQGMANGTSMQGMRPSGQGLSGLRPNVTNQRYMGHGALQASDSVIAGAVPRPAGVRLPMAVP